MALYSSEVFAGGWTVPKGGSYTRLTFNYYFSDTSYSPDEMAWGSSDEVESRKKRNIQEGANSDFTDWNVAFYIEYGLHDRLSLTLQVPYKSLKSETSDIDVAPSSIGDIDVGFKFLISDKPLIGSQKFIITVQGQAKIPEAYKNVDTNEFGNLAIGNGQYDYELRMLIGRSLWDVFGGGYFGLEGAYRWRLEDNLGIKPSDEWRVLLELGFSIKDFFLRVKTDLLLAEGNNSGGGSSGGTLSSDYDLWKGEFCLGYWVSKHMGLEYLETPAFMGRGVAHGYTRSFALFWVY